MRRLENTIDTQIEDLARFIYLQIRVCNTVATSHLSEYSR
jgi:hypothetical protein